MGTVPSVLGSWQVFSSKAAEGTRSQVCRNYSSSLIRVQQLHYLGEVVYKIHTACLFSAAERKEAPTPLHVDFLTIVSLGFFLVPVDVVIGAYAKT